MVNVKIQKRKSKLFESKNYSDLVIGHSNMNKFSEDFDLKKDVNSLVHKLLR